MRFITPITPGSFADLLLNLFVAVEIWRTRPLPMILRCYCAVDSLTMNDNVTLCPEHPRHCH
eukprot:1279345-Amphidinium_carterae.1